MLETLFHDPKVVEKRFCLIKTLHEVLEHEKASARMLQRQTECVLGWRSGSSSRWTRPLRLVPPARG